MSDRLFARYPSELPIKFVVGSMIGEHRHYLMNASQGGVCLRACGCIDPGTPIHVCIPFTQEPCDAHGKVAWCKLGDRCQYLMGVRFDKRVNKSAIQSLNLIEHYKEKIQKKKGIRLTSEEAAVEMDFIDT